MSWDGKMCDKYRIEHTDGTPLKGKKYFVLRLDSDDPVEAARVATAMRAYKNELRNCDVGTAEEQQARHHAWCCEYGIFGDNKVNCSNPDMRCALCALRWAQMPYEEGGEK